MPDTQLERYADLPRPGWRGVGRELALSALWQWNRQRGAESALERPRVQFLYLHHLFPDEVAPFRALLHRLATWHTFISYSDAVERVISGPIDRPYVAFSFDDGLHSCAEAADVLAEFGTAACFFICPGVVGLRDAGGIRAFCEGRLGIPPTALLDWPDVERMLKQGHEIGAHTVSHPDLATLTGAALQDEIAGSRALLEARVGTVRHFAWPYGSFAHFSPEGVAAVQAAGFRSCASAERGCHVAPVRGDAASLCIRRDQVLPAEPMHHVLYFCTRNARAATVRMNDWPAGWAVPAAR